MKRFILVAILFFIFSYISVSQNVKEVDFKYLSNILKIENDSVYMLNFWATWCRPCVAELPAIDSTEKHFKNDKFRLILVSLDHLAGTEKNVIPFVEKRKINSEVVLLNEPDQNSWINKVSEEWQGAIPGTLIFTKGFRKFYEKELTFDELESTITPLLKEKK